MVLLVAPIVLLAAIGFVTIGAQWIWNSLGLIR